MGRDDTSEFNLHVSDSEMSIDSDVFWPFVFTYPMDFLSSSLPTVVEVVRNGQVLDIFKGNPWIRDMKERRVEGD